MSKPRHFVDLSHIAIEDLRHILDNAVTLKEMRREKKEHALLKNKQLAMIFEKPSTRTRVSFEAGINELGGHAIALQSNSMQIGRGEPIEDTAKVLSRYVDMIMIRCFNHELITKLAECAQVPVINGLTDFSHPCQIMADIMTFNEHRGNIAGKIVAWVGDGNNVTHSWIHAAQKFGFTLKIATPTNLSPASKVVEDAIAEGADIILTTDPKEAVHNADLVTTDTWFSMGDTGMGDKREQLLPYQIDDGLMAMAHEKALFMHCLPAHREDEVTASVIDGEQSVVFDEAENRLHVQKSIMVWACGK